MDEWRDRDIETVNHVEKNGQPPVSLSGIRGMRPSLRGWRRLSIKVVHAPKLACIENVEKGEIAVIPNLDFGEVRKALGWERDRVIFYMNTAMIAKVNPGATIHLYRKASRDETPD